MRIISIVTILAGILGASLVGISRGVGPWREQDFVDMNIADMHHALAIVAAGSLISMALGWRKGGRWGTAVAGVGGIFFLPTAGILAASMMQLDKVYWREEPFLTFAALIAGGLVALAISVPSRQPGRTSRDRA